MGFAPHRARNAIIPAAVGVDIGCGMAAVRTDIVAEQPDLVAGAHTPADPQLQGL
ncbi:MAG TPA: RtcB family protein [Acidimicrobiales bacterium]|nr:RtcB family protein [Acidimicrobiales bacterium]